jgi:hypothetical protein
MAKTTAKPVPPDGDPPDANHPETMSLKTTTWLEEPDYDPPGKASKKKMETRKKFQQRFRDAVGSTTYQWNYYTVYGWYHFDDPARFVTIWKKYNEKTTEAKLQKAQYIWKVYQFHRNNDLEVPPHLHSRAEHFAQSYLREHDNGYISRYDKKRTQFAEEIEKADESLDFTYADKEGSPDTLMKEASGISDEQAKLHERPVTNKKEIVEVDDEEPNKDDIEVEDATKQPKTDKTNDEKMETVDEEEDFPPLSPPHNVRKTNTDDEFMTQNGEESTQHEGNRNEDNLETEDDDLEVEEQDEKAEALTTVTPEKGEKEVASTTSERECPQSQGDDQTLHTVEAKDAKVNDGTYRFSVQWSPANYDELKDVGVVWSRALVPTLKLLLENPKAQIHAWDSAVATMTHAKDINEFNVRKFLSPAISPYQKTKTFFFGLRVSFSDMPPQVWLAEPQTKASMKDLKIRISVSNSSCDSGRLIIAGFILLKDPALTHRHRYNQSLRVELPESTPHFDIQTHRKTPDDEAIPHLAVQCGEKHIGALTEILQSHMCGKKRTAVFIGRQSFQQMGPQAVKELFKTHDNYVKSLTKIPMLLMTNVDRIRQETMPDGSIMERSMRHWAENLKDDKGQSMQCDVENGGRDRNAYMLAPKKFENKVKSELKAYRERIRPFKQREEQFHASLQQPGRPNSIYVPTQSAISNIAFLQSFTSSADHWREAPDAVKLGKTQTRSRIQVNLQNEVTQEETTQIADDATVATSASSHSGITTKQSDFDLQFERLEQTMKAQSDAMHESAAATAQRFSQLETNMLKAMTNANNAMTRVSDLEGKVDKIAAMMETVTMYIAKQTHQVTAALPDTVPNQSPTASLPTDEEMSTQSSSSSVAHMQSPAHKKVKSSKEAPSGDQYKDPSSEAGGKKC